MGELRKDYILNRWVVYSTARGSRPRQFKEITKAAEGPCLFCKGNESQTPSEIGRIGTKNDWKLRWFANKYPALEPKGDPKQTTTHKFFTDAVNYGYHEVIVESPKHDKQLSDLSEKEIADVLGVYQQRIADLGKKKNIAYVNVIKNHGARAGTSIVHTHSQVMATTIIPPVIQEKIIAIKKFLKCPYCEIITAESDSSRKCFENSDWLAFCPFASRYNYEIWIAPKKHIKSLAEANLDSLAEIMKKVLSRVSELKASYNFYLTYSPPGENLHFHIEIMPEIAIWGGLERGSGIVINSVFPEEAAKFYRGE